MRSFARFRELDGDERRLLVRCLIAIPGIVVGVRLLGFRRMRSGLAMWPRPARFVPRSSGRPASERARVIARVAGIAAARGPVRATCLRRSLLIWWLLRREGIESALRIGVRHEAGTLQAHAWVEHEGVPLGEMNDPVARYASLDGDFGRALGESG